MWVTVSFPVVDSCLRKIGITLPTLPRTLPNRTATNTVGPCRMAMLWITSSASRFVAPITFVGRTALSVETRTNRSTPNFAAASATFRVPSTFVFTASTGWISIIGTCLYAAAWKMIAGRWARTISSTLPRSRTSPITGTMSTVGNFSRISSSK